MRNAPRNWRKDRPLGGSSTYSTAPASAQSMAEISAWPAAIAGDGSGSSKRRRRSGRVRSDGREQIGRRRQHQEPADRHQELVSGQLARGGQRTDDEAQSAQPEQTQPERHRVREDDPRELLGRDAPSRVEAIPHRGAGQHREADVVGNRVRQERRQRDARARKRLADVGERQQVVAGERRVVEGRQHERRGRAAKAACGSRRP